MGRAILSLSVLLWATAASAQSTESWRGPTGCPSADEIREREEAHPAAVRALSLGQAAVHIQRAPTGELRARLTLRPRSEEPETRTLRGTDCEALAEATLLVLDMATSALGASPSAAVEETPAPPADPPTSDPPKAPAAPVPAPLPPTAERATERTAPSPAVELRVEATPAPAPRARPPARLGLLLVGQVDRGSLPGAAFVASGGALFTRGRYWVDLRASYFVQRTVRLRGQPARGADIGQATASAHACYRSRELGRRSKGLRPRAGVCLVAELGAARGEGVGLEGASAGRGPFAAALLGGSLALGPLRGVLPFLQVELGPVFTRPSFEIQGEEVHRADGWLLRASLGAAWLPWSTATK